MLYPCTNTPRFETMPLSMPKNLIQALPLQCCLHVSMSAKLLCFPEPLQVSSKPM